MKSCCCCRDFVYRVSELVDTRRWKRGRNCRSGSLFRNLFSSASKLPSTPSESDDHHNQSAGDCALQETLERVARLKHPRCHQCIPFVRERWSFTREDSRTREPYP